MYYSVRILKLQDSTYNFSKYGTDKVVSMILLFEVKNNLKKYTYSSTCYMLRS